MAMAMAPTIAMVAVAAIATAIACYGAYPSEYPGVCPGA